MWKTSRVPWKFHFIQKSSLILLNMLHFHSWSSKMFAEFGKVCSSIKMRTFGEIAKFQKVDWTCGKCKKRESLTFSASGKVHHVTGSDYSFNFANLVHLAFAIYQTFEELSYTFGKLSKFLGSSRTSGKFSKVCINLLNL